MEKRYETYQKYEVKQSIEQQAKGEKIKTDWQFVGWGEIKGLENPNIVKAYKRGRFFYVVYKQLNDYGIATEYRYTLNH